MIEKLSTSSSFFGKAKAISGQYQRNWRAISAKLGEQSQRFSSGNFAYLSRNFRLPGSVELTTWLRFATLLVCVERRF